jgi:hypothetical protein
LEIHMSQQDPYAKQSNRDASQNPGAASSSGHPVGVGVGAVAAGAAAGAVGGALAGPVGAVAGAVVGGVVGGMAGKAAAESINPTVETKHWSENYSSRPYAQTDTSYEEYAPAYQYGWEMFDKRGRQGQSFDSIESELSRGWNQAKGSSRLGWDKAKVATREAWDRVEQASRGNNKPTPR